MVETVAAYLGILDVLVRLARYGDRRLRRGISTAVQALGEPEQFVSVKEAREAFHIMLIRQLGANRAGAVERAVQVIEQVSREVFEPAMLDHAREELLPYGTLLGRIITAVGVFLDRSRVFEARQILEFTSRTGSKYREYFGRLLDLPYTWHLLRLCRPTRNKANKGYIFGYPIYLCLWQQPSYNLYRLRAYYDDAKEDIPVRFREIEFPSDYQMVFPFYVAENDAVNHVIDIDVVVFEALILGLLMDVIAYDQRVLMEIQTSTGFIRNLIGMGRDKLVLPF
jgi:hypothetical protein